jgi:hypothetical protein
MVLWQTSTFTQIVWLVRVAGTGWDGVGARGHGHSRGSRETTGVRCWGLGSRPKRGGVRSAGRRRFVHAGDETTISWRPWGRRNQVRGWKLHCSFLADYGWKEPNEELSIWPGFADHRSAEHCGMQKMPTWICRSSLPLQGKDRDRIDRQARMLVRSCCSRRFVPYVRLLHGRTRHLLGWVSDEASVVVARGTWLWRGFGVLRDWNTRTLVPLGWHDNTAQL